MSIIGPGSGIGKDFFVKRKKYIESWLNDHHITNYKISLPPSLFIDVDGSDVNLMGYNESSLPDYIVFNEIRGGNFICSYSNIESMRGFPKMVGRNLDISFSRIISLEDAPELVDKDFVACGLRLTEQEIRDKTRVTCKVYC